MNELRRTADALRRAARIAVFTGAGMSAESGIPTFREAQTGLWERFRPEELASPDAFKRDPVRVWEWYRWRRELVDRAEPNAGHRAIAELQRRVPNTVVITQNVDSLHQAAGSSDVIELHGSIHRARCTACHAMRRWEPDEPCFPPLCTCKAMLRPDIVWFGEMLPDAALSRAFQAVETCDVLLSIGTSSLVQPAASLPWVATKRGALVAIINVDMEGQLRDNNVVHLTGEAGTVLPQLLQLAFPEPS